MAVVGFGSAERQHVNVFGHELFIGWRGRVADVVDQNAHVTAGIAVLSVLHERRLQAGDEGFAVGCDAHAFHAAVDIAAGIIGGDGGGGKEVVGTRVSRAKLWHVVHALWEAATPPPRATLRPPFGRRQLAEKARVA